MSSNSILKNSLNVTLLNARSLKSVTKHCNKLVPFSNLAAVSDSNIIAVTETWLNKNVNNTEILDGNYILYRRDCHVDCSKKGGGILLAVKRGLNSQLVL